MRARPKGRPSHLAHSAERSQNQPQAYGKVTMIGSGWPPNEGSRPFAVPKPPPSRCRRSRAPAVLGIGIPLVEEDATTGCEKRECKLCHVHGSPQRPADSPIVGSVVIRSGAEVLSPAPYRLDLRHTRSPDGLLTESDFLPDGLHEQHPKSRQGELQRQRRQSCAGPKIDNSRVGGRREDGDPGQGVKEMIQDHFRGFPAGGEVDFLSPQLEQAQIGGEALHRGSSSATPSSEAPATRSSRCDVFNSPPTFRHRNG